MNLISYFSFLFTLRKLIKIAGLIKDCCVKKKKLTLMLLLIDTPPGVIKSLL